MKKIAITSFLALFVVVLCGFISKPQPTAQTVCEVKSLKNPINCKDGDILLYEPDRKEEITWARMQHIFQWDIAALYCDFDRMILDKEECLVCVVKKKSNADEIFSNKVNPK